MAQSEPIPHPCRETSAPVATSEEIDEYALHRWGDLVQLCVKALSVRCSIENMEVRYVPTRERKEARALRVTKILGNIVLNECGCEGGRKRSE